VGPHGSVTGIDISAPMLARARARAAEQRLANLRFLNADAQSTRLDPATFDLVYSRFGVMFFADPKAAFANLRASLAPGGRLAILEFGQPRVPGIRNLYAWYFRYLLPLVGRTVSKHRSAYSYLPASVGHFPPPPEFARTIAASGFSQVHPVPLTLGIVYLYVAQKG
jgi:demethylmenaquinone methyltransferase/2-methoxy-6-polyprenyl-1,4-benzoquinol methylase